MRNPKNENHQARKYTHTHYNEQDEEWKNWKEKKQLHHSIKRWIDHIANGI